jgi:hypothetical protein
MKKDKKEKHIGSCSMIINPPSSAPINDIQTKWNLSIDQSLLSGTFYVFPECRCQIKKKNARSIFTFQVSVTWGFPGLDFLWFVWCIYG